MKQEILSKLKSAEEDTARRIEAARSRAADLVKQAERQAQDVLRQAQEEAQRDQANELQQERARLEQERGRILAQAKQKEDSMRSAFRSREDEYVRKALAAFTRSLNA